MHPEYPECIPGGDTTPRCSGSVSQSHNTGLRPGQRTTPAVAPPGQKVFKDVNVGPGKGGWRSPEQTSMKGPCSGVAERNARV